MIRPLNDELKEYREKNRLVMEGFPVKPLVDYIFVADLGQPNRTESGVILGDSENFARYKHTDSRWGIVCAVGPGRLKYSTTLKRYIIDPALKSLGLKLGDTVIFSRRLGTRINMKFHPPGVPVPLFIRVLDPTKVSAIVDDFVPWWDIEESVLRPDVIMSG